MFGQQVFCSVDHNGTTRFFNLTKIGLMENWVDRVPGSIALKYADKKSVIEEKANDHVKVVIVPKKTTWIECKKDQNGEWFEKEMSMSSSSSSWVELQSVGDSSCSHLDV